MEHYTEADYVLASPLLQAVKPDLGLNQIPQWTDWRDTGRFEELDSDQEIDIDAPFHPALRGEPHTLGRPADDDDDEQEKTRSKRRKQDGLLISTMDPRLSWADAFDMAQNIPPDLDDSSDEDSGDEMRTPGQRRGPRTRKRHVLPIKIHTESSMTTIKACSDSGSDENIMSLETVKQLQVAMELPGSAPRRFSVANGKLVETVGQVAVRLSFGAGLNEKQSFFDCIFQVFTSLAVPAIMGTEFLHMTETLTKHRDRLVEELVPAVQSLRVNSIGTPQRNLVCRLDSYVGCATADTGSDLDLISPTFARSRGFQVEPSHHQLEFADCSVGFTSGVITSSLSIGNVDSVKGFLPRGEPVHLDFYVLDDLSADILLGQDTVEELNIFGLHAESFIPSIPKLGESDVNIIRYIGSVERRARKALNKLKPGVERVKEDSDDPTLENQRENARRESARNYINTKTGLEKSRAQEIENDRIRAWEEERERQKVTTGNVHQTTTIAAADLQVLT